VHLFFHRFGGKETPPTMVEASNGRRKHRWLAPCGWGGIAALYLTKILPNYTLFLKDFTPIMYNIGIMVLARKLKLSPTPEQKSVLQETLAQYKTCIQHCLKCDFKLHSDLNAARNIRNNFLEAQSATSVLSRATSSVHASQAVLTA